MGKLRRQALSLDTMKLAWGISAKKPPPKQHSEELKTSPKLAASANNQLKRRLKKSRPLK
jgi:hypothetical protein